MVPLAQQGVDSGMKGSYLGDSVRSACSVGRFGVCIRYMASSGWGSSAKLGRISSVGAV